MYLYFRAGIGFIDIVLLAMMMSCKPTAAGVRPKAECEKMDVNINGEWWYLCKVGDMRCVYHSTGLSCFRDIYY